MRNDNSINPDYTERAVSVYGNGDALDDFPVLKAFQQYIDAEQAKARKRLLAMGIFFGVFMLVVVAIFVILLVNVSNRNQQLNDRLVEFAMRDRTSGSAVVVQPSQDSAAVLALTSKLEEMNRKIAEAQTKADKAVAEAEAKVRQVAAQAEANKSKATSAEELEIQRLKAQLAFEKEKAAAEKARQKEAELEAYRRKHYPELYAPKQQQQPQTQTPPPVTADNATLRRSATRKRPTRADERREREISQLLQDIDDLSSLNDNEPEVKKEGNSESEDSEELAPVSYFEMKNSNAVSIKDGDTNLDWGIPN